MSETSLGGLHFAILGSGSSGNAALVATPRSRLLLDAGLTARETDSRLKALGQDLQDVDTVLVTHEHDDHVRGLVMLSRERRIRVVATRGTHRALRGRLAPGTELLEIKPGTTLGLEDLEIDAIRITHDAREPVAFRMAHAGAVLGYITDVGCVGPELLQGFARVDALIAESNHDVDMLKDGPYPNRLKKRILGPYGHLSNEALGQFLREAELEGLQLLYLAHLSRANNRPELARAVACLALSERGLLQVALKVALPDAPGELEAVMGRPSSNVATRMPASPGRQLALQFDT